MLTNSNAAAMMSQTPATRRLVCSDPPPLMSRRRKAEGTGMRPVLMPRQMPRRQVYIRRARACAGGAGRGGEHLGRGVRWGHPTRFHRSTKQNNRTAWFFLVLQKRSLAHPLEHQASLWREGPEQAAAAAAATAPRPTSECWCMDLM